jgi:hypothetical protein
VPPAATNAHVRPRQPYTAAGVAATPTRRWPSKTKAPHTPGGVRAVQRARRSS